MLNNIGESTEKSGTTLRRISPSTLEEAAKSLQLEEKVLAMAVGWLVRRQARLPFVTAGTFRQAEKGRRALSRHRR